ncbi:MAG: lytic transglycosylase domain-containing protein [Patescibacteria group bacterium]
MMAPNTRGMPKYLFVFVLCFILFLVIDTKVENNKRYGDVYAQIQSIKSPLPVPDFPYIPDTVYFFGGRVPFEVFGVWEDTDEWIRFFTNTKNRWRIVSYLGLLKEYSPIIDPIFKEEGVPTDMKFVGIGESGFNSNAVSSKGATGFWQFIRSTAIHNGLKVDNNIDERRQLESATRASCSEMKTLYQEFRKTFSEEESWWFALASYNAGPGRIWKAIHTDGEKSYFKLFSLPRETERYIPCMIALKLILENPEHYGFVEGVTYGGPKMVVIEKYFSKFTPWKVFLSELRNNGHDISLKELTRANTHIKNKSGIPKGNFLLRIPDRKK